jgi:tRNA dimethylallyltransferase
MAETNEMGRPRVVILLGPTGIGKSKLAIELAEELGGEIVSADSMQVYRYMDIGTAKPTPDEQKRVRHHLIDLVTPDQPFHAGLYRTMARHGLFTHPKIDPHVRKKLKQEAEGKGEDFLYQRLRRVDPKTASRLHPHDLFRTIRALEVFDSTGVPISFFREQHRFGERPYFTLKIGLEMDREDLYRRIEERVDQMIEKGFLQEVRELMKMGYSPELKPMQNLGYKQMVQFLLKKIGWTEAVQQIKKETRHYAKRQWVWFKADPEVYWRREFTDREKIYHEVVSFVKKGG